MLSNNHSSVLLALLLLIVYSCDRNSDFEEKTFDRLKMLENISSEIVLPSYADFLNETEILESKMILFNSELNLTTFNQLKAQWKISTSIWEKCEIFNIGDIQSSVIHNKIDTWPSNINFIENFIAGTDELTSDFINTKGSSSKGLPAIEYLLFDSEEAITLLTIAENADRRRAYLFALIENLKSKAEEVIHKWTYEYQPIFNNDPTSDLGSSISVLVNQLISITEQVAQTKLAKPMGKTTDGLLYPDQLESYRSGMSLQKIQSNLLSIRHVLFGKSSSSKTFLADYASFVESDLDSETMLTSKILTQLNEIDSSINLIEPPLTLALENQFEELDELYEKIRYLFILLNVDLSNDLGVVVTLNINDGD